MIRVKVYYHQFFTVNYMDAKMSEHDGIPVAEFENQESYNNFLQTNSFKEHTLPNDMKVVVTDEEDSNIIGKVMVEGE